MVDFQQALLDARRAGKIGAAYVGAATPIAPVPDVPPPVVEAPPREPEVDIPAPLLTQESFLTGNAGTGKSYLARAMARQLDGTVLTATTGIASVNLGEGTTTNSLLGYFDTESLRDAYTVGRLTARLAKLSKAGIRRIVIDEVSMLDGQQLTLITRALDELRGEGHILDQDTAETVRRHEVAPIDLLLTADFGQLPPVKAPFAFEAPEWPRYEANMVRLTEIRRQTDPDFIAALQAARSGNAKVVGDYFGAFVVPAMDANFPGPTVLATNDAVSRLNALRLDQVPGTVQQYAPVRWGDQPGDWKQIPELLQLKDQALVMILANRKYANSLQLEYSNGDLGEIVEMRPASVIVRLQRNDALVEVGYITRERTVPLEPGRRKALKAINEEWRVKGAMEIVGTISYLPVRLAWGTTVFKSQGLSLDRVQVNTREGMFKMPGLLYVALSRARTVGGLRLVGTVAGLRERCTVHPKILKWL